MFICSCCPPLISWSSFSLVDVSSRRLLLLVRGRSSSSSSSLTPIAQKNCSKLSLLKPQTITALPRRPFFFRYVYPVRCGGELETQPTGIVYFSSSQHCSVVFERTMTIGKRRRHTNYLNMRNKKRTACSVFLLMLHAYVCVQYFVCCYRSSTAPRCTAATVFCLLYLFCL